MGHYRANVRDLEFNLFEVLDVEKTVGSGEFGDLDADTIHGMVQEAARQAHGPLAEGFVDGDRHPPTFDVETHSVTLPESFKECVRVWQRGPWPRLGLPTGIGHVNRRPPRRIIQDSPSRPSPPRPGPRRPRRTCSRQVGARF